MKTIIVGICFALAACNTVAGDPQDEQPGPVMLQDLPDIQLGDYKVDPYLRAAATLQAMGKDKAQEALLALAKKERNGASVILLCRMLFAPKAGAEFRRPLLGAAHFLGKTDYADWPREPIELVDGVPFLITGGYSIAGEAEPPDSYLKYCLDNCDWNTFQFKAMTGVEKQQGLEKLVASPKWKAALNQSEIAFLSSQIR